MQPYTTLQNNSKFQTLLERGYTESQIQGLLQQRRQQMHQPRQNQKKEGNPYSAAHTPQSHTPQMNRAATARNPHAPPNPPFYPQEVPSESPNVCGPLRPQQNSIEQSIMFSYQNQSNERRAGNVVRSFPENVPPRAHIQMQFKPDKSSVEGILQNTYQQRKKDTFVPQFKAGGNATATANRMKPHPTVHTNQAQHATDIKSEPLTLTTRNHSSQEKQKMRRTQFEQEMRNVKNEKQDAYALLKVDTDYTLKGLAKKYKKQALQYHPDRLIKHSEYITPAQKEHCAEMFKKITKAYLCLVEDFGKRESDKPFYELKEQSQHEFENQEETAHNATKLKLGEGDNFNAQLFNTLYEENRLYDVNDEGYDQWFKTDDGNDTSKLFSSKFNANVFNTTFEQLKKDNPYAEKQLVKHQELGVVVHTDSTPFSTLGEGKIKDFTGNTSSLQYSDLKDAHTTHTTLIDASRVQQQPTFRSVKEMEAYRSQIQHTLSPEEAELQDFLKQKKKTEEHQRMERLQTGDRLVAQQHAKIQQRLLQ